MSKAKILLVEDSRSRAEVTKNFPENNGYEVDLVEDDKSAIKKSETQLIGSVLPGFVLP